MKNFFAQIAFAFLLTLSIFVYAKSQTAPLQDFDAYVEKALKEWEIPGVTIALVKDDKIVFARGYGIKKSVISPATTYRRLYYAVKRKDFDAIKSEMSGETLQWASEVAKTQKKTLPKLFENGLIAGNILATFPEIQNERTRDNFGALEIKNPEGKWDDIPFIRENDEWKIAIGEIFRGKYKSPCRLIESKGISDVPVCKPENFVQTKSSLIDEHTIFGVASNSKAFTAAALAMLVDEGKISWDDKVTKYLSDYQLYDPYVTREITIRDLLTHRSGLPAYGGDILWWGGDYSRDEIIRRVRFVKPKYGFRSTYAYQNIPFITAGRIVEKVSGKAWEQFVKERIFMPLQMSETTTSIKEFKPDTNKVTPHFRDIETGKTIPIAWRNLDAGAPAAGINSNILDMAQWLRLQLNDGKFDNKQLISERQMREMHTPQMLIPFSNPKDQPKLKSNFRAYGFGWNLREYAGYKMVLHGGWTDGQLTQTAMLPEKHLGVVVLSNIHNRDASLVFINRIFDAFLSLEPTDWNAYYLKRVQSAEKARVDAIRKKESERNKNLKPQMSLSGYAGNYENDLYGKISFAEENGKLVVRLSHSPTFIGDLEPWEFNTFRVAWRDPVAEKTFLTFVVGDNGQLKSVKMAMASFVDDAEYEYSKTEN